MKISAWHKRRGDTVEWFNVLDADSYDMIFSSKIFTYTPKDLYLPTDRSRVFLWLCFFFFFFRFFDGI